MFLKQIFVGFIIVLILGGVGFGIWEGWKFFEEKRAGQYYGEETLAQRGFIPLGHWGKRETEKRKFSETPFVIDSEVLFVKNTDFFQKGNITVSGTGKLIFQNSVVEMTAGETRRAIISLKDRGELIFENSTLKPHADNPENLYVHVSDEAKIILNNSNGIHSLTVEDRAVIQMNNSTWAYSMPRFRGGRIEVRGSARAEIKNSVIGGLTIELPQSAKAAIIGFKPGKFDKLDVSKEFALEKSELQVLLEDSEILGEDLEVGGLKEWGLSIVASADIAKLQVIDSELNKFVIQTRGIDFKFTDLLLDTIQNFTYRNIGLENSKVMTEWGVFMEGGKGEITQSEGLWMSLKGNGEVSLKDSEISKFEAENFTGIIELTESIWMEGGEIWGQSDFTIRGSVLFQELGRDAFEHFLSQDSKVTRNFSIDAFLLNPGPIAARGATIEVFDKDEKLLEKVSTDKMGGANFPITFDNSNFREKFFVKISKFDQTARHEINFFTPTPIKLIVK